MAAFNLEKSIFWESPVEKLRTQSANSMQSKRESAKMRIQ